VHASLFQDRENLKGAHVTNLCKSLNLNWAEAVQINGGVRDSKMAQEVGVPRHRQRRVDAPLHQNPRPTDGLQFDDSLGDLLVGLGVGLIVTWGAIKRTELTVDGADIRVVDVPVNEVGDLSGWVHDKPPMMRCCHQ